MEMKAYKYSLSLTVQKHLHLTRFTQFECMHANPASYRSKSDFEITLRIITQ